MMKKTAILVFIFGAAFGVLLLTTGNARFLVQDSLLIEREPRQIWQALTDVEHWPRWWPGVETARLESSWAEGKKLELTLRGNSTGGTVQIECYRPGAELMFTRRGVLGSRVGNRLLLEPQSGAVLVTVESLVVGPQAVLARITGKEAFAAYHLRLLAGLREAAGTDAAPRSKEKDANGS